MSKGLLRRRRSFSGLVVSQDAGYGSVAGRLRLRSQDAGCAGLVASLDAGYGMVSVS